MVSFRLVYLVLLTGCIADELNLFCGILVLHRALGLQYSPELNKCYVQKQSLFLLCSNVKMGSLSHCNVFLGFCSYIKVENQ